ncbi:MAG TPA: GNAT family N-acetyltransferase, partial [Actinomycetota bacterium]|nr:GNAT family N-acetyltransferase [Actinomycetota bacterium]
AVAPRTAYPRVLRSRVLRPTDSDLACWAVVCFYVVKQERRGGVAAALLEAAVAFAADHGAASVEGYPKDTDGARKGANEMFVGSLSMFQEAGFEEAARNSPGRPIMRRTVKGGQRRPRRARR